MKVTDVLIDCPERVACDVCARVCPQGVVTISPGVVARPVVRSVSNCSGCGLCVAHCPGQAVFLVNREFSSTEAAIALPWELQSCPASGQLVDLVDNRGVTVTQGTVLRVRNPVTYARTAVVVVVAPKRRARRVRGVGRQTHG